MSEEGKKSIFNAGIAQVERIDELQKSMNMARFNPLMFNPVIGIFNYEVMIKSQDGLLEESWSKLTTPERDKGDKIKNLIHEFVEIKPIFIESNTGLKINTENYKRFKKLIDIYAKNNKIFLDAHNLNSPNIDEDDEL